MASPGDFARRGLLAQAFDLIKLRLRDQPARHAFLRFAHETGAIILVGRVHFPWCVVALFSSPLNVTAMNDDDDLVFFAFFILVPPTELHAHGVKMAETLTCPPA